MTFFNNVTERDVTSTRGGLFYFW